MEMAHTTHSALLHGAIGQLHIGWQLRHWCVKRVVRARPPICDSFVAVGSSDAHFGIWSDPFPFGHDAWGNRISARLEAHIGGCAAAALILQDLALATGIR